MGHTNDASKNAPQTGAYRVRGPWRRRKSGGPRGSAGCGLARGRCMACRGGPGPGASEIPKIHATASQTVTTTRDKRHGVRCRNDSRSCPPHMAKMRRSIACGGGRGPTGCARWYSTLVSMRSRLHFFPPVHQSVCVSQALVGVPRLASPPDWPPSVDLERCPVQRAKGSVRVLPAWDRLRVTGLALEVRVEG